VGSSPISVAIFKSPETSGLFSFCYAGVTKLRRSRSRAQDTVTVMNVQLSARVALLLSLGLTGCSGSAGVAPVVATPSTACENDQTSQFTVLVTSDAEHTHPQCQYNVSSNSTAYIYVANVAPSDFYVLTVESASGNPSCVYTFPQGKAALPSAGACRIGRDSGVQAAGGNLSGYWEISSSLPAGAYTIGVYDRTQNALLGTVQVSLTSGT
jgi:hypothetical protein